MKKLVSLFLSVCLLICFNVPAFSFDDELTLHYAEAVRRNVIVDNNDSLLKENSATNVSSFYQYGFNIGSYVYSAYSQLSVCEKMLYDYLVISLQKGELSARVEFSPALSSADFSDIDWQNVLEALVLDHPEFFYVTVMGRSWATYSDGSVAYVVLSVKSTSYYDSSVLLYSEEQIPACTAELESIVKSIDVDLSNRYNFVKSLHDYLCNNIEYVNNKSRCHDAYGALVEGVAVCQGYAEAFKMICDYYKVPSVCITGTANGGAHMWNAVQMDDGLWYLLDVTWDDQTEKSTARIFYDFFLIGLNTSDIYFGGEVFSVSHASDGSPYLPFLKYATEKYTQTDHFTEFQATYNCIVKLTDKYLIRSFYDAKDSFVYYDGMYVEVTTPATNLKFSVPSGTEGAKEDWTLILVGDCNGDSTSDATDYSDAVNKVLAGSDVSTVYDIASDASCDGYLDVIDLAILERAINGKNTNIILE